MKITINAKSGYWIGRPKDATEAIGEFGYNDPVFVMDGKELLFIAGKRPYSDFREEVERHGNEAASFVECFMTRRGNKIVYWVDYETGEDFVSKVEDD